MLTFYDKMRIACHFEFPELQKMLLTEDDIEVVWNGKNWCVDLKKYG